MKKNLVTIKQAIALLNEAHQIDPQDLGRDAYSSGTIYNAIHAKKLKRYGLPHCAQVDTEELLRLFGPKKAM